MQETTSRSAEESNGEGQARFHERCGGVDAEFQMVCLLSKASVWTDSDDAEADVCAPFDE